MSDDVIELELLPLRVTLLRKDPVETSPGRWSDNYQPHLTEVPFRIWGMSDRELWTAAQEKTYVTHVAYGLPGLDIRRDDLVDTVDGKRYRVRAVRPPSLPHHVKIMLEEIQRG
jgi:hypothetical protein